VKSNFLDLLRYWPMLEISWRESIAVKTEVTNIVKPYAGKK
jgi:hypothetical protein